MALIIPAIYSDLVREQFLGRVKIANLAMNLGGLSNTTVGDTITFPRFELIGDAELMTKGTALVPEGLSQTSSTASIKQIGKAIRVFDMDSVTGMGNQISEASNQQALIFARQIDLDLIEEAQKSPLKVATVGAKAITALEINEALGRFGDDQDVEDIGGIVINSLLASSFYSMDEFVSTGKTYNVDGNGIVRNGCIGEFRGIPVFMADHSKGAIGTYDSVKSECVSFIIKKNALAFMEKKAINIEESRMALLKASDIVGDYIYAVKNVNSAGIVVLRKTIA